MSNPNALFLLADHIKLSLLERQRAKALDLESDSQDGHISRSLDQFREGLELLEKEKLRFEEAGDEAKVLNIADAIPTLQKQYGDLTSQLHGFSTPSSAATLTRPNAPSLAADFAHATTIPGGSSSSAAASQHVQPAKPALRAPPAASPNPKTVRFQDNPQVAVEEEERDALAAQLFNRPYRDDDSDTAGYRDHAERAGLGNEQLHAYHSEILAHQDEQLDTLGASIGRQRELSLRIGDELDSHVAMLEESERLTDHHQGRLDRARNQMGRFARSAGESKQMVAIIVLIVILVLLIAILK